MRTRCISLALAGCSLLSCLAKADVAYTFPIGKGGFLISPGFDAVEGNLFEVGPTKVEITELAYEQERTNQESNPTAIFDATTGKVLRSAQISGADPLSDGYFWNDIQPLVLFPGHEYYIGSLHGTGPDHEYIWNTHTAVLPSDLVDLGTWFKVSSTIDGGFWQFGGGTSQYDSGEIRHYVGNFQTASVPAPPAVSVLAAGLWTLIRRRRTTKGHQS